MESTGSLEDIRLLPGDALQIQPLASGLGERLAVRVVGMLRPVSLLVTAPAADGRLVPVREQQPFLVRAVSSLNVCAFRTVVLKVQHAPFPYLHLDYPESVKLMRIRKAIRAKVQMDAAIHESDGGPPLAAGRILDISAGGARVQSGVSLGEKGRKVFMSFTVRLDDIEERVVVPAVICSTAEEGCDEGNRAWMAGVQFADLSQQSRLLIMNLVYQYLLKEGH